jgi:hypothetical protein
MASPKLLRCRRCGSKVPETSLASHANRCLAKQNAARGSSGVRSRRPLPAEDKSAIMILQEEALAKGLRWIKFPCIQCGAQVPIHVSWEQPVPRCKSCRTKYGNKRRQVRMVSGGLPTLGKRR